MSKLVPAIDLVPAIHNAIARLDAGQTIEVYTIAKTLQPTFPDLRLSEIVKKVSEVAVRKLDHCVVWHDMQT